MMQSKELHCYLNRVRVQLVSEKLPEYKISDTIDAKELASNYLRKYDRECFITLLLGGTNRVVAINEVSVGTLTNPLVHPREVFKAAILANASSIILAHNHPSGEVEPSDDDIHLTERLREAGGIMGIKILDHLIVGEQDCYSFHENEV